MVVTDSGPGARVLFGNSESALGFLQGLHCSHIPPPAGLQGAGLSGLYRQTTASGKGQAVGSACSLGQLTLAHVPPMCKTLSAGCGRRAQ